jgi:hypothetical protein
MGVKGCYRAVFKEVADIEELFELQAVLFAHLGVRRNIVKFAEAP